MFKTITSLLTRPRTLNAELELDHFETGPDHLILGLELTWTNTRPAPVEIGAVLVNLFHRGEKEQPVPLIYHGRFVRIPFQKTITKIAGATSFHLAPGETLVENIRFLTRDLGELPNGMHAIELHTTVVEGTYVRTFDLKIVPELRLGGCGTETETGPLASPNSAAFTRALRIGLNTNAAK
jgi:hypothetical protein